jgi:hypothetical protein
MLQNCSWSCYGNANLTIFESTDGSARSFARSVSVFGPRGSREAAMTHRSGYSSIAWTSKHPSHIAVLWEKETVDLMWTGGLQLTLIPLAEFGSGAFDASTSAPDIRDVAASAALKTDEPAAGSGVPTLRRGHEMFEPRGTRRVVDRVEAESSLPDVSQSAPYFAQHLPGLFVQNCRPRVPKLFLSRVQMFTRL